MPTYAVAALNQSTEKPPQAIHMSHPPDLSDRQKDWMAEQLHPPAKPVVTTHPREQCFGRKGCTGTATRFHMCDPCFKANAKSGVPRWCMTCRCGMEWVILGAAASAERRVCPRCGELSDTGMRRGV